MAGRCDTASTTSSALFFFFPPTPIPSGEEYVPTMPDPTVVPLLEDPGGPRSASSTMKLPASRLARVRGISSSTRTS